VFEVLVESKPKKERTAGQFMVSMVVHALVITGAVVATKGAAEVVRERIMDTTMVLLTPPKPEAPPPDQDTSHVVVAVTGYASSG